MHTPDRVLMLRPAEGTKPLDSRGMFDTRLFKGENKLHARMDLQTCLWSMHYDIGLVPEPLRQKFTSFNKLLAYARSYFNTRNVEISEIVEERNKSAERA